MKIHLRLPVFRIRTNESPISMLGIDPRRLQVLPLTTTVQIYLGSSSAHSLFSAQTLKTGVLKSDSGYNICHFRLYYTTECPKILEPMGIVFVIYIICSRCSPRHSTHFLSRFTMFVRILLHILGSTVAQQSVILCLRWRRCRISTAYTCAFRNPQKSKFPSFHPMLMPLLAF
jgi:hypothetical protein